MKSGQSPSKPALYCAFPNCKVPPHFFCSLICLVNVPDAQIRPCGHSIICRYCTQELMTRSQPCPVCRKDIVGFDIGVYNGSLGERGMWLTLARNLRELVRNDGFNEYFQKQFNGNEEPFLRWKEVFDVLDIVEEKSRRRIV